MGENLEKWEYKEIKIAHNLIPWLMSAINTVMASFLIFEIPVSYHEVVFVDDADKRGVKFEPSFFLA